MHSNASHLGSCIVISLTLHDIPYTVDWLGTWDSLVAIALYDNLHTLDTPYLHVTQQPCNHRNHIWIRPLQSLISTSTFYAQLFFPPSFLFFCSSNFHASRHMASGLDTCAFPFGRISSNFRLWANHVPCLLASVEPQSSGSQPCSAAPVDPAAACIAFR
jgi:hypothetical protein